MVKAVVVRELNARPEVCDVELAPVGDTDVRVRITAAGVCHSDLSMVNGTVAVKFPIVLGHEASGVVVEFGAAVDSVAVGDGVVLNWAPPCRHCWFCRSGEPWLCSAIEGITSVEKGALADGTPLNWCLGVGAFAEQVVVPACSMVPAPAGIPLELAGLMGCAVLTGVGAVRNTAKVRHGQSALSSDRAELG